MQRLKVIGCGSLLMGDDAVGCAVARELQKESLPGHVKVIEAGTPGLDLLNLMEAGERVIIVDAVVTGCREAGAFHVFREEEIPRPGEMPASAHAIAIPEAIALGRQLEPERMPDVIEIWGVEILPPVLKEMQMSGPVARAVPRVVEMLKNEIFGGQAGDSR
jgi:hydrogenase maturation protease